MSSKILRTLAALELEERLLNAGSLIAALSVFLPWVGGDWLGGDKVSYTGLGFYTSFLGMGVLVLQLFVLSLTVVPLLGGPMLVKKRFRETVRLFSTAQALILLLAVISVLMRVTFEFSRMEMRFGLYICLAGCILAFAESVQRSIIHYRARSQETFQHPEDRRTPALRDESLVRPAPPPPPPAPLPDDHRLRP